MAGVIYNQSVFDCREMMKGILLPYTHFETCDLRPSVFQTLF